jgi:hypothetical protein
MRLITFCKSPTAKPNEKNELASPPMMIGYSSRQESFGSQVIRFRRIRAAPHSRIEHSGGGRCFAAENTEERRLEEDGRSPI